MNTEKSMIPHDRDGEIVHDDNRNSTTVSENKPNTFEVPDDEDEVDIDVGIL